MAANDAPPEGEDEAEQNLPAEQEESAPSDPASHIAAMLSESRTVRSGPLPSPDDFASYGETLPDAPDRILSMTEKGQDAYQRYQLHKLYVGLAVILCALSAVTYLGATGQPAPAMIFFTGAGISGAFTLWRNNKRAD